jgi:hypothetical protein
MIILHPEYRCGDCERKADVVLYHFGRNNGYDIQICHGCEHYIRDCYPDDPPPDDWLARHLVQPDALCRGPVRR